MAQCGILTDDHAERRLREYEAKEAIRLIQKQKEEESQQSINNKT